MTAAELVAKYERQLRMKVSGLIIEAFDGDVDMPRGDFQGVSEALAMKIIETVRAS